MIPRPALAAILGGMLALALGVAAFYVLVVLVCGVAILAPFIVVGCLARAAMDVVPMPWIGRSQDVTRGT